MSKFEDDLARGCLPTGEPLECLYGMGWWTEMPEEEPEPDPVDLHIAELEARIAELEAAQRWIPVSERLPEETGLYLVWQDGSFAVGCRVLYYSAGRSYLDFEWEIVTHWIPLPARPEVRE